MVGRGNLLDPHSASPAELKEQIEADRGGLPWLLYRDGNDRQRIVRLAPEVTRVTLGRAPTCDVCLSWDGEISRLHAQLERLAGDWTIVDDGLSRNGTFVNAERLLGRRHLYGGDLIRCGQTDLAFRAPIAEGLETAPPNTILRAVPISEGQRRVLIALCRPYASPGQFASPPTNQAIADELVLSVIAVKGHLRQLFQRFGIEHLSHNEKRAQLVALAFETGTITLRDLEQRG